MIPPPFSESQKVVTLPLFPPSPPPSPLLISDKSLKKIFSGILRKITGFK